MKTTVLLAFVIAMVAASCVKPKNPPDINFDVYPLPGNTFFPEGIAYDRQTGLFYTGSSTNGNILSVNVETARVTLFAEGNGQQRKAATGMKLDKLRRLWICGGSDKKIHVLTPAGTLLKQWDTKALFNSGFINDCIIDGTYIYFTDSDVRQIYRIDITNFIPKEPELWLAFSDADIHYEAGEFNLNGIESTPDNKYLIVVNSFTGKLFRIDKATKNIAEIKLNTPVTYGDGLYFVGNTLYVSRNALNKVFPVALNADYSAGEVGEPFGDNLLYNTTIARAGDYFLVVNGQLNTTKPTLPFTVSRIKVPY